MAVLPAARRPPPGERRSANGERRSANGERRSAKRERRSAKREVAEGKPRPQVLLAPGNAIPVNARLDRALGRNRHLAGG